MAAVAVAQAELQVTAALMEAMERPEMYHKEEPGREQPPESLANLQANSILAVAEVVLLWQVPLVILQLVQVPLTVERRKTEQPTPVAEVVLHMLVPQAVGVPAS